MRRHRADDNQKEIVEALREIGMSVDLGHNDILVGYQGASYWYEIKNKSGRNRLQPSQEKLKQGWKGHYKVVYSLDDILSDLGLMKYKQIANIREAGL